MNLPSALLCLLLIGCQEATAVSSGFDDTAFSWVGRTFLGNPEVLSLKEIHLGSGALIGKTVIIEGQVADVSEHGTYLILADDAARMLVVLTELVDPKFGVLAGQAESMRVLGTIESGKKGLPFLKAQALNLKSVDAVGVVNGKA